MTHVCFWQHQSASRQQFLKVYFCLRKLLKVLIKEMGREADAKVVLMETVAILLTSEVQG